MVKIYIICIIKIKPTTHRTLQYHAHQYFFVYFVRVLIKVITLNHLPFQIENRKLILKNVFSSHKYLILCFQHCIYFVCYTYYKRRVGERERERKKRSPVM